MKAYTDVEQSKKLAEILPIESADMLFQLGEDKYADNIRVPLTKEHWEQMMPDIIPCWSLAALLKSLPEGTDLHKAIDKTMECYYVEVFNNRKYFSTEVLYDNPIDTCYEIILKLKENNLL